MNIDQYHPEGKPSRQSLDGFPMVRMPLRWRRYQGETLVTAFNKQAPYIDSLHSWGKKVVIVVTHSWGLEGRGYDWTRMTPSDWNRMENEYIENLRSIVVRFGDKIIYQIQNEPDGVNTGSSVIIPVDVYGQLFNRSYNLIKGLAPKATVITAGLKSGPENAIKYFSDSGISRTDAIAIHEYGRGGNGSNLFKPFGSIEHSLNLWSRHTSTPIWITEWGVLDQRPPENQVAEYASEFLKACAKYPSVQEECWFAYGNQHNGYGAIDKARLQAALVQYGISRSATPPDADNGESELKPSGRQWVYYRLDGNMNYRKSPSLQGQRVGLLRAGENVMVDEKSFEYSSGYAWKRCWHPRYKYGWVAIVSGVGRTPA